MFDINNALSMNIPSVLQGTEYTLKMKDRELETLKARIENLVRKHNIEVQDLLRRGSLNKQQKIDQLNQQVDLYQRQNGNLRKKNKSNV